MKATRDDDWTSASFRAALLAMVRRRVPAGDADDVVQAALTEAVATADRPRDPEGARRWIWGVARHKIADYHRRSRREDLGDVPEQATPATPEAERDLLRWAVGELPADADAQRTFAWLLREGEGEKLEAIADDEQLPPPQVRQRVSRMRRLFRTRWAQLATAGLVALALYLAVRSARSPVDVTPHPSLIEDPTVATAITRGRARRIEALHDCDLSRWLRCLDGLDLARSLDPAGDATDVVQRARVTAHNALLRAVPPPTPTVIPESYDGGLSDASAVTPTRRPVTVVAPPTPPPVPSAMGDGGVVRRRRVYPPSEFTGGSS